LESESSGRSNETGLPRLSDRSGWSSSSSPAHRSQLSSIALPSSLADESGRSSVSRIATLSLQSRESGQSGLSDDADITFQSLLAVGALRTDLTDGSPGPWLTCGSGQACRTLDSRHARLSGSTYTDNQYKQSSNQSSCHKRSELLQVRQTCV